MGDGRVYTWSACYQGFAWTCEFFFFPSPLYLLFVCRILIETLFLNSSTPPHARTRTYTQTKSLFQFNGVVGTKTDVPEDLDAGLLWKFYGVDVDEEGMYA